MMSMLQAGRQHSCLCVFLCVYLYTDAASSPVLLEPTRVAPKHARFGGWARQVLTNLSAQNSHIKSLTHMARLSTLVHLRQCLFSDMSRAPLWDRFSLSLGVDPPVSRFSLSLGVDPPVSRWNSWLCLLSWRPWCCTSCWCFYGIDRQANRHSPICCLQSLICIDWADGRERKPLDRLPVCHWANTDRQITSMSLG